MPPVDQASINKMLKQQQQQFKTIKEGFSTMNLALMEMIKQNNDIQTPIATKALEDDYERIKQLEDRIDKQKKK